MAELNTTYLGIEFKNPVLASSSPLTQKLENIQKMEAAGIAGVVLYSLFEEQIARDGMKLHEDLERGAHSYGEALSYLPDYGQYTIGPENYLEHLANVKNSVGIPVFGSLNGVSTGGWTEYARKIEDAGADALELNFYFLSNDLDLSASELENRYISLVDQVRSKINIPLAIKLSPFFTALPNFASKLTEAGADGLVLFNRFYQPDFDLEELKVVPNLVLSSSDELRLPLRWIAILYDRVNVDLALTSGIHTSVDVLKALMAGAKVTTIASSFLMHGIESAAELLSDINEWLDERDYSSVNQMIGSMSQKSVADPDAFERANYMKVLSSY